VIRSKVYDSNELPFLDTNGQRGLRADQQARAPDSLVFAPAHELARAIRAREVSAVEVLEAHLQQIAQHNPTLNAIVTLDTERARQRAQEADAALARSEIWGPLHGVPVTIKDAFETAGLRTTSSYKPLAKYLPQQDATVVARLRAAGAIILAKTNMSMLATDFQSNSPVWGRANNPWDVQRTAGGSSGGSAAAVAAGLSPLDIGSDLAGSIRVPAHFCGVFGLKPTELRVSSAGHIPDWCVPGSSGVPGSVRHMGVYGPLARSIADLRLCLSLIEGPDGRQAAVPPVPPTRAPEQALREYRIAWTDDFGSMPVTAETRATLETLVGRLAELGCRIERHNPPGFDFTVAWQTWGEIAGGEVGAALPAHLRFLFRVLFLTMRGRSPINRGIVRGTGRLSMWQYLRALARRDTLIAVMEQFLTGWDAWLCPVTVGPAFTHRKTGDLIEVDDQRVPYMMGGGAYTSIFNLTGNPVVVLPAAHSREGLPIGVQVVGRHWSDLKLLAIAEQVVEVTRPFQRPPGY
jgi:amidase